jgi:hypothetical protein
MVYLQRALYLSYISAGDHVGDAYVLLGSMGALVQEANNNELALEYAHEALTSAVKNFSFFSLPAAHWYVVQVVVSVSESVSGDWLTIALD